MLRVLRTAWLLLLSLLARLALLLTLPLAWLGWEYPSVQAAFYILYYDERATDVWDGK